MFISIGYQKVWAKGRKVEQVFPTRIEIPFFLVSPAEGLSGHMSHPFHRASCPGQSLLQQSHTHYFRGCLGFCPTNFLNHKLVSSSWPLTSASKFTLGPLLSTWKTLLSDQCAPHILFPTWKGKLGHIHYLKPNFYPRPSQFLWLWEKINHHTYAAAITLVKWNVNTFLVKG